MISVDVFIRCFMGDLSSLVQNAKQIIIAHGGVVRTKEALSAGIHPRTLYRLRDTGELIQVSRGVFQLRELEVLQEHDLVTVARCVPDAVICLVSALSFHELTTQIPRQVDIAIVRGSRTPGIEHPPVKVYHFALAAFNAGVEGHVIEGVEIRVYSPEKTLADCFKFRNRLGMEVVLEALSLYRERREVCLSKLVEFADICRVKNVMRPYLEMMT